jgi:hypothetical protein
MALLSQYLGKDERLKQCQVRDAAHIKEGASGSYVSKIQRALWVIDALKIDKSEVARRYYGPSTAAAVLAYKRKRRIINYSYQSTEDNIVGRMTITALDKDIYNYEQTLRFPFSWDV